MAIFDWVSQKVFNSVHQNNLVYNTCWEDPRLDRVALDIGPTDNILVITSAGCNALDYVLNGPQQVHAVDMNPRQNALLELKKSAVNNLEYDQFWEMFGQGRLKRAKAIYHEKLRGNLTEWSQKFWDKRIRFFDNNRKSFYFRGTSGSVARMINIYVDRVIKARPLLDEILAAKSLEEQKDIYENRGLKDKFWTGLIRFAMNRDTTLSMLGVPKAQRRQLENQYEGGIVQFIHDCLEAVFTKVPIQDNYFWRVYLNGAYTPECCPEYLKADNFEKLRSLVDRVQTHTDSVQGFLENHTGEISRFVLLDHMDWLSDRFFPSLVSEWQAIVQKAAPGARVIWRSGGLKTDFIDQVQIKHDGQVVGVNDLLKYHDDLATDLHQKDRVHTYASFYIADLST